MELELRVNGEVRQKCATRDMIHAVPKILRHVSRFMTLEPGDVVATGTPAGVGACKPDDVLEARIPGVASLTVRVVAG
jgi:fumarylpyruvate hydrolase